jgi:hypothetical protein
MAPKLQFRFLDLPVDIVELFCQQFCRHCHDPSVATDWKTVEDVKGRRRIRQDRTTLASLARTCKVLNHIATPVLYHWIYATEHRVAFYAVRTLLQQPRLAGHVRSISVLNGGAERLTDPGDKHRFAEAAKRLGIDNEAWQRRVAPPVDDPAFHHDYFMFAPENYGPVLETMITFLLLLCSNAREAYWSMFGNLMRFKDMTTAAPSLPSLRTLYIDHRSPTQGFFLSDVAAVISAAPELETLHLRNCMGATRTSEQFMSPVSLHCDKLRELTLIVFRISRVSAPMMVLQTFKSSRLSKLTFGKLTWKGETDAVGSDFWSEFVSVVTEGDFPFLKEVIVSVWDQGSKDLDKTKVGFAKHGVKLILDPATSKSLIPEAHEVSHV